MIVFVIERSDSTWLARDLITRLGDKEALLCLSLSDRGRSVVPASMKTRQRQTNSPTTSRQAAWNNCKQRPQRPNGEQISFTGVERCNNLEVLSGLVVQRESRITRCVITGRIGEMLVECFLWPLFLYAR